MLVSVAIPAYNQAEFLREAIESVLAQTYQDIEIVVVDDGSTDHTRDVCQSFGGRVRYVHQENDGTFGGGARTRAIRECKGDFVAILDQDDRWLPNKIASQVEVLKAATTFGAAFTGWRVIDAQGHVVSEEFNEAPSGDVFHLLLQQNWYLASSAMVRREILLNNLNNRGIKPDDYYLWLAIARNHKVAFISECLTEYRRHEENYSLDFLNMALILEGLLNHLRDHSLFHPNCEMCSQALASGLVRARETKAEAYFQEYCRLAKGGKLPLALANFRKMLNSYPTFILNLRRILATIKSFLLGIRNLNSPYWSVAPTKNS
jgi:glycosyltransferase involved in cell wall biosynthesis